MMCLFFRIWIVVQDIVAFRGYGLIDYYKYVKAFLSIII